MTKTWLMRRAVRRPVLLDVTARINSSVCRLPFIRSSPLASRMSSTPWRGRFAVRCIDDFKSADVDPRGAAAAEIFAAGPTKIGMIMPASAASTAPRNELSSQGWATTVVAGGTCFALAMSRSYFERGGWSGALLAEMVPTSLSL